MRFGRKQEETLLLASRTFLHQNVRDQTAGKPQQLEPRLLNKPTKKVNDYFNVSVFWGVFGGVFGGILGGVWGGVWGCFGGIFEVFWEVFRG